MGVSSTARLPNLSAQSIPALFNHIQTTSGARVVTRWSITIRSFRAVPVPASAYPRDEYQDIDGLSSAASSSAAAGGDGGPMPLTKPRTMWQIWISEFPGLVFVLVEDSGKVSRAKVWRDWEVRKKAWRKAKRAEAEQAKSNAELESTAAEDKKQAPVDGVASDGPTAGNETADQSKQSTTTNAQAAIGASETEPKAGEIAATTASTAQGGASTDSQQTNATGFSQVSMTGTASAVTGSDDDVVMVDGGSQPSNDSSAVKPAGARPKLRMPSHTRLTLSVLSASLPALLSKLNLPPPHGAPVGTAGPGAWVPRGAAVSIEGLVLDLGHFPGTDGATDGGEAAGLDSTDWRVRVGSVVGGGGRGAGAIIDAEFLPLAAAAPSAGFLAEFLQALLPPNLGPMTTTAIGGSGSGSARAQASANQLRGSAGQFGGALGYGNRYALNGGAGMMGNGYKPPQPPMGGAATASQSGAVSMPVISDQLWEEVVPRSAAEWKRIIEQRSQAEEVRKRQKKLAAGVATSQSPVIKMTSPFDWHTATDPQDEAASSLGGGGATDGSPSSDVDILTDTDAETDVPLAAAEDSDEDDDKPLGLLTAQAQAAAAAAVAAPAPAQPQKKDDGVRLHFEGLRGDVEGEDGAGWSGVERGRRMAFTYVQLLRAEGLI